jgi:hypothetical protein
VQLLEALADDSHPDHEEMTEWVGDSFNPFAFSPEQVTFSDPDERWQIAFGEDAI